MKVGHHSLYSWRPLPVIYLYIIHYTNLTVVRLWVCDREVNGSHSTCAKKFCFSASLDLDATPGSSLTAQRWHYPQTKVSRFERRRDRIRSISRLCTATRCRPGDGERATFRSRRCPRMLHWRRRFYSKRLFFGAIASEAVSQLSSFCG